MQPQQQQQQQPQQQPPPQQQQQPPPPPPSPPPPPQQQQQQQQQGAQGQPAYTNANVAYEQDKRDDIGHPRTTQQGTLAGYETVPKDDGIGNDQVTLSFRRQ